MWTLIDLYKKLFIRIYVIESKNLKVLTKKAKYVNFWTIELYWWTCPCWNISMSISWWNICIQSRTEKVPTNWKKIYFLLFPRHSYERLMTVRPIWNSAKFMPWIQNKLISRLKYFNLYIFHIFLELINCGKLSSYSQ